MKKAALLSAALIAAACAKSYRTNIPYSKGAAAPGTSVALKGARFELYPGDVKVGDDLVARVRRAGFDLDFRGRVAVIITVPSVDTEVCEAQTHVLAESKELKNSVDRMVVSRDLPMAQERFAREAGIKNVRFFSDYKGGKFGRETGLLIKDKELLTRGVIVLDARGIVRYAHFVPELTELPDMPSAFKVANKLAP